MFLYVFDPFSYKMLEGTKNEEEGKKERNCFLTNIKFLMKLDQSTSHNSF